MKIALLIRGISFNPKYINRQKFYMKKDYKDSNLLSFFLKNYNFDTFLVTYNSLENENIIKYFNPIDYKFLNFKDNSNYDRTNYVANINLEVLKLFEKYKKNYDLVILTRFDLMFKKNLKKLFNKCTHRNFIKINKFNIPFYCKRKKSKSNNYKQSICDNLLIFNSKYTNILKTLMNDILDNKIMHT